MSALLKVADLRVRHGSRAVVDGIDFTLDAGQALGIVGESGSGKSQTALAVLGLCDVSARVSGSVKFAGRELIGLRERDFHRIRGAQLAAREGGYATLRLRSGEMRRVHVDCRATIGEVGHGEHNLRKYGKAGAMRWRGIRPTVRGVAMNPVDHPHGGGEGKTSGGRHPVSPWGTPTKGKKTRRNKRTTT